jgi:hypothetical protein
VLTTNRGVASSGEVLGDTTVAAMLDRLLHRSVVLNLDGGSSDYPTTTPRTTPTTSHDRHPPTATVTNVHAFLFAVFSDQLPPVM